MAGFLTIFVRVRVHRILSVGLHVSRLLVNASKGRITGFTKIFKASNMLFWVVVRALLYGCYCRLLIGCTGRLLGH